MRCLRSCRRAPPFEPGPHQLDAPLVERSQREQRRDGLRREHVAVGAVDTRANLQSSPLRHDSSSVYFTPMIRSAFFQ